MRKVVSVIAALSMVLGTASLVIAQAKTNFAGKWTLVVDPNAPAPTGRGGRGGGFGGLGQGGSIEQNDKTITVTTTGQAGEVKSVYNLDGSESKNAVNFGGNAIERVSKAKWDGAKLVIETTTNIQGNPVTSTQTWSLAEGNLVIESTSNFGGNPTTTKQTYKKG